MGRGEEGAVGGEAREGGGAVSGRGARWVGAEIAGGRRGRRGGEGVGEGEKGWERRDLS